jgi:hypothetical protein
MFENTCVKNTIFSDGKVWTPCLCSSILRRKKCHSKANHKLYLYNVKCKLPYIITYVAMKKLNDTSNESNEYVMFSCKIANKKIIIMQNVYNIYLAN